MNAVTKRRKRSKPSMVHTAIVLPAEMIDRLKSGGRNISSEIRRRLESSLRQDAIDEFERAWFAYAREAA